MKKEKTKDWKYMKTTIHNLRRAGMLCVSLALMALTLGSCASDIENIQPSSPDKEQGQTKYPTTTIRMYIGTPDMDGETQKIVNELASNAKTRGTLTRALTLDGNGKVEADQDFVATCYIINERTQQLGKFTYKWKTKRSKNNYLLLEDPNGEGKLQNISVTWVLGSPSNNISGDDWKVCAVAGGTEKEVGGGANGTMRHSVSFQPQMVPDNSPETKQGGNVRMANNNEPIAFVSNNKPITMRNGAPFARFKFKMPGTLVKIKVKRDDNVSKSHDYFLKTNALHPMGVFCPITDKGKLKAGDISTWWESTCPLVVRNFDNNDNYILHLNGKAKEAIHLTKGGAEYDVWYMWGMPTDKTGVETMMGSWTGGYILKQAKKANAQGPFISKHDFKKDGGKMRTLTANVHDSEPYPAFNFLNFLSRAAKHNIAAPKTWWDNDCYLNSNNWPDNRNGHTVWYTWDDAMQYKKVMPEDNVWHTPSLTELTTLFPFPAEYGKWKDQGKDVCVCPGKERTFQNENDLYLEWMTLYAEIEESNGYLFVRDLIPDNGGDLAAEQMKDLNTQGFFSNFYTTEDGKTTYAIRFFRSSKYGDRLCCAYKWETHNWPNRQDTNENQLVVTSRWIGNAPLKVSDIMSDAWWNGEDSKFNVQVKLPCQGESAGIKYTNYRNSMTMIAGSNHQTAGVKTQHFARVFSSHKGGTFQRKTQWRMGFIHPFTNLMMCNEKGKWGEQYNEEGSGHGSGKNWPRPKTGWHANPR
ncbi:hypothetical protein [Hoylesella timonensis]|uniref:hypothetical protein n=1 Tax=Hoylesella timonensis TaxID=386414 RepID=UPI00288C1172|nr:hypothetical protein [Hoylesella timonensis]